jgi:hypothetical protein
MHESSESAHVDDPMADVNTERGAADDVADPSPPVEAQVPPPGYEPQTELAPGQEPGIRARPDDPMDEVEAEVSDDEADADDGDDDAEDGDAGEPGKDATD